MGREGGVGTCLFAPFGFWGLGGSRRWVRVMEVGRDLGRSSGPTSGEGKRNLDEIA